MVAAGKGRLADAQALLASGADPLARARDGSAAADWAARFGHADTAAALREHAKVHRWQNV
jgi:ankyrin repeat protein